MYGSDTLPFLAVFFTYANSLQLAFRDMCKKGFLHIHLDNLYPIEIFNDYRYKDYASDSEWKNLDIATNAGGFFRSQPQKGQAPQLLTSKVERLKLPEVLLGIKALNKSGKVRNINCYN